MNNTDHLASVEHSPKCKLSTTPPHGTDIQWQDNVCCSAPKEPGDGPRNVTKRLKHPLGLKMSLIHVIEPHWWTEKLKVFGSTTALGWGRGVTLSLLVCFKGQKTST